MRNAFVAVRPSVTRTFGALVDFLDPRAAPVQRPYMGGAPSLKMFAHYDSNGIFEVDLWQEGKGFILDLTGRNGRTQLWEGQ